MFSPCFVDGAVFLSSSSCVVLLSSASLAWCCRSLFFDLRWNYIRSQIKPHYSNVKWWCALLLLPSNAAFHPFVGGAALGGRTFLSFFGMVLFFLGWCCFLVPPCGWFLFLSSFQRVVVSSSSSPPFEGCCVVSSSFRCLPRLSLGGVNVSFPCRWRCFLLLFLLRGVASPARP